MENPQCNKIDNCDKSSKAGGELYHDKIFVALNNKYGVVSEIYDEMEQIKNNSIEGGLFLKAPNGLPSNLDERLWLIVRTKNFKKWFGDRENDPSSSSKILDENGEPKIVYHGTNRRHISEFKIDTQKLDGTKDGVYFVSNKKKAKEYSLNGTIYENFLNIRNPLIIDFKGKYWCNLSFRDAQILLGKNEEELKGIQKPYYKTGVIEDIMITFKKIAGKFTHDESKRYYAIDDIVKIARHLGYDGIIAKNVKDIGKFPSLSNKTRKTLHDQIIVLDPNQIKDINNVGTFSKNSNDTKE